jgi:hypothetical protein
MVLRMGKTGALILWVSLSNSNVIWTDARPKVPVCLTAFFVVQTALQACSRTIYAFSRDHGMHMRTLSLESVYQFELQDFRIEASLESTPE